MTVAAIRIRGGTWEGLLLGLVLLLVLGILSWLISGQRRDLIGRCVVGSFVGTLAGLVIFLFIANVGLLRSVEREPSSMMALASGCCILFATFGAWLAREWKIRSERRAAGTSATSSAVSARASSQPPTR